MIFSKTHQIVWFIVFGSLVIPSLGDEKPSTCKASTDCGLYGVCFTENCVCPLGYKQINGTCKAYLCDVNFASTCDQWSHARCGDNSKLCYCDSGYTIDEYHVNCIMSGTTVSLIVFVSIFAVLTLLFCCCSCFEFICCLSLFPVAIDETTIILNDSGKQAIKQKEVNSKKVGKEQSTKSSNKNCKTEK